jgi:hypothetical protein
MSRVSSPYPLRRPLRVLVVHHDPACAQALVFQLDQAGCESLSLAGAGEALDYLDCAVVKPDLALAGLHLPNLRRLAQRMPGDVPLLTVGAAGHLTACPSGCGHGLLPQPLPIGTALEATLRDLLAYLCHETQRLVPLDQAAGDLDLDAEAVRWQLYIVLFDRPMVRAADVACYARLARLPHYAAAIQCALQQGAWRNLSWPGRAARLNQGLPPDLRLNRRAFARIARGQDRELARAIRVLTALRAQLGVDLTDPEAVSS